jgi:hypothetical protein
VASAVSSASEASRQLAFSTFELRAAEAKVASAKAMLSEATERQLHALQEVAAVDVRAKDRALSLARAAEADACARLAALNTSGHGSGAASAAENARAAEAAQAAQARAAEEEAAREEAERRASEARLLSEWGTSWFMDKEFAGRTSSLRARVAYLYSSPSLRTWGQKFTVSPALEACAPPWARATVVLCCVGVAVCAGGRGFPARPALGLCTV